MITQQTAYSIYACQREILCAKELLKTMEEQPHRLATSVIRAHIAEQERKLVEVNEQARIELETK